jgi:hypothetical protein
MDRSPATREEYLRLRRAIDNLWWLLAGNTFLLAVIVWTLANE